MSTTAPTYDTPVYTITCDGPGHNVENNPREVYYGSERRYFLDREEAEAVARSLGNADCDWGDLEAPEYTVETGKFGWLDEAAQTEALKDLSE